MNFVSLNILDISNRELSDAITGKTEDEVLQILHENHQYISVFLDCLKKYPEWTSSHKDFVNRLISQIDSDDHMAALFKLAKKVKPLRPLLKHHLEFDIPFIASYQRYCGTQKTSIPITTRNCANFLSDAFMKDMVDDHGEGLEGNSFDDSMEFFITTLESARHTEPDPDLQLKIDQVLSKTRTAMAIFRRYLTVEHDSIGDKAKLDQGFRELSQEVKTQIETLKPGESLLLPCGYSGSRGGHAMLCEFIREDDGSFKCLLINTGDGLDYHHFIYSTHKIKSSPVLLYSNLSLEEVTDDVFLKTFFEPFSNIQGTVSPFSAQDIYAAIFSRFKEKMITIPENMQEFMTEQRSGSCSVRVLMAYLRLNMGAMAYKKMKFQMNKLVLSEMLAQPQLFTSDKIRRTILQNGVESLCRSALRLYPELSDEITITTSSSSQLMAACSSHSPSHYPGLHEVVALIEKVDDFLKYAVPCSSPPNPVGPIPSQLNNSSDALSNVISSISSSHTIISETESNPVDLPVQPAVPAVDNAIHPGEALQRELENIESLVCSSESLPPFLISLIQTTLLNMPIPNGPMDESHVWNEVKPERCLLTLHRLTMGFVNLISMENDFYPETRVALEKILTIAHFQACRLDRKRKIKRLEQNKDIKDIEHPCFLQDLPINQNSLLTILSELTIRIYNPQLEKSFDDIMNYYAKIESPSVASASTSLAPVASSTPLTVFELFNYCTYRSTDEYTEDIPAFAFRKNTGEWKYLSQFESQLTPQMKKDIDDTFRSTENWSWEVRCDHISLPVQLLWAEKVEAEVPRSYYREKEWDVSSALDLVPSYFRKLVDISLVIDYWQVKHFSQRQHNEIVFDPNSKEPLTTLKIINNNQGYRRSFYTCAQYTYTKINPDKTVASGFKARKDGIPIISYRANFTNNRLVWRQNEIGNLATTTTMDYRELNQIYLTNPNQIGKYIVDGRAYESLRAQRAKNFLEGSVGDLMNPDLQLYSTLLFFSCETDKNEFTVEPLFAEQMYNAIEKQSKNILLLFATTPQREENTQQIWRLLQAYTYLQLYKVHFLSKLKLHNIDFSSHYSAELIESDVIKTRISFKKLIDGFDKLGDEKMQLLYHCYIAMFVAPPPPTDEELLELFYLESTKFLPKYLTIKAEGVISNDAQTVLSVNSARFRDLLEHREIELRNSFLSRIFKERLSIQMPSTCTWEGVFPEYSTVVEGNDLYQIIVLTWNVKKNGLPIADMSTVYSHEDYKFVFSEKRFGAYMSSVVDLAPTDPSKSEQGVSYIVRDNDGDEVRFALGKEHFCIEKQFNGVTYRFIPWRKISKPEFICLEKQPVDLSYEVWGSVGDEGNLRIVDRETKKTVCLVKSNGQLVIDPDHSINSFHTLKLTENDSTLPLARFEDSEYVLALENGGENETPHFSIRFQRYRTNNDEVLEFTRKNVTTTDKNGVERVQSVLQYDNNPLYYIDNDQSISGLEGLSKYLIVRNAEGKRRVIIPMQTYHSLESLKVNQELTSEVITIDLNHKGQLAPRTLHQKVFSAYLQLVHKDYLSAFKNLEKANHLNRYPNDILRLLGWILLSDSQTQDFHPNAVAVRSFAGWLGNDNLFRNQKPKSGPSEASPESLYDASSRWEGFWENTGIYQDKSISRYISDTYVSYLNLRKAVHTQLRFDVSRRKRRKSKVSLFEEKQFLHALIKRTPEPHQQLMMRYNAISSGVKITMGPFLQQPTYRLDIEKISNSPMSLSNQSPEECLEYLHKIFPRTRQGDQFSDHFPVLLRLALHDSKTREELLAFLRDMHFDSRNQDRASFLELICEESKWGENIRNVVRKYATLPKAGGRGPISHTVETLYKELRKQINNLIKAKKINSLIKTKEIDPFTLSEIPVRLHVDTQITESLPESIPSQGDKVPLHLPPLHSERDTLVYEKVPIPPIVHRELLPLNSTDPFVVEKYQDLVTDFELGKAINDHATEYSFTDPVRLKALKTATKGEIKQLDDKKRILKNQFKELANKLPRSEDEKEILRIQLQRGGKKKSLATTKDCIGAFLQASHQVYHRLNPFLNPQEIDQLHQLLGEYLQCSIESAQMNKQLQELKKGNMQQLGILLEQKTEYNPNEYPAFLVFEYYTGFRLRADQVNDIKKMIPADGVPVDCFIQKIMGAGKTLVLGTLLSLLKADGYHLSIFVPPPSLFNVNAQDMKIRAESMFGQRVRTISISRNKEHFELSYLRYIHETLIRIIRDREVLIAAPDTLLTIRNLDHLARQELVTHPEREEELTLMIQELKSILKIIKQRGVGTLDELDITLDITKEHIMSVGAKIPLPPDEIDLVKELYAIASIDLAINFQDNRQTSLTDAEFENFRLAFASKAVDTLFNTSRWRKKLGLHEGCREELVSYLSNPETLSSSFVTGLYRDGNHQGADLLEMVRQEICCWIPASCKASAHCNYGFLTDETDQHKLKNISIPYSFNRIPNKKSDFSHRTVMMNRTFQLYCHTGLDSKQVCRMVESLKTKLKIEFEKHQGKIKVENLPTSKLFKKLFGISILSFNDASDESIKLVQNKLTNKDPRMVRLLLDFVADEVLAKEKIYMQQIPSDAHNLANMFKVRQGFSGTLEEVKDMLPVAPFMEQGTNGRVLDVTLSKNYVTHVVESEGVAEFVEKMFSDPSTHRFRAIIDIGPRFKGIDSKQAAVEILQFMLAHPERGVRGVLYWDDETEMPCCVKSGREQQPIVLESSNSEEIYAATELSQEELFVFFPHHKLTGSDVALPDDAKALCTISESTTLRDLFQGEFRLRKIFKGQQAEMVITPQLLPLVKERVGGWEGDVTVSPLILFLFYNTVTKQKNDLLWSAIKEVEATVADYIDVRILNSDSVEEEQAHFMRGRELFIKSLEISFFLLYGLKPEKIPIEDFLSNKIKELITMVTGKSDESHFDDLESALVDKLNQLKIKLVQKLPGVEVDMAKLEFAGDKTVEQQQEQSQQQSQEVKTQSLQETLAQISGEKLEAQPLTKWTQIRFNLCAYPERFDHAPALWKLDTVDAGIPKNESFAKCMSGNLYATDNFVQTLKDTVNLFDEHAKPIYEVLALYNEGATEEDNPWTLVLLSSYDSDFFKTFLSRRYPGMETALMIQPNMGVVQQGALKFDELSESAIRNLRRTMIPILFLNGDIETLNRNEWIGEFRNWVSVDQDQKRELFETHILKKPNRPNVEYFGSKVQKALYTHPAVSLTIQEH